MDLVPPQVQEPIQGLTQDPVCSHPSLKFAKGFPEVTECRNCKSGFFKVDMHKTETNFLGHPDCKEPTVLLALQGLLLLLARQQR